MYASSAARRVLPATGPQRHDVDDRGLIGVQFAVPPAPQKILPTDTELAARRAVEHFVRLGLRHPPDSLPQPGQQRLIAIRLLGDREPAVGRGAPIEEVNGPRARPPV